MIETLENVGRQCVRWYCRSPFRGKTRLRRITDQWLTPEGHIERVTVGPIVLELDHRFEATRNMAYGVYESDEISLLRRILGSGDVAVDVGANVGYLSAHMAQLVGPTGKVYSFEPGPTPFQSLASAKESNAFQNQEVFQMAIGKEDRESTYFETENILSKGYGRIDNRPSDRFVDVKEHTVRVTSLTSFFAHRPIDRIKLIKIDVEGHEKDVIQGLTGLFGRGIRPTLITEISMQGKPQIDLFDYQKILATFGYQAFSIGPIWSQLKLADLKSGFHGNVAWVSNENPFSSSEMPQ